MAKPEGRILSLDVGERRIGVALSDEFRLTVRGLPTLVRTNRKADFKTLSNIIQEHEVKFVVLGNPVHISGEKSDQSRKVERFGERLRKHSGVKTEFWDERLTSVEAEEMIGGRRLRGEERKQAIDQAAAVLILESYLRGQLA